MIGLAILGVPVRIVETDEIDDRVPTLLELAHKAVDSGFGDRGVVESVHIGVADEEQFLAGDTVDLRVMRGGHRRPRLRLDIDRQHSFATVATYEHVGSPGRHCFQPPGVDHADDRRILGHEPILLDLAWRSIQVLEDRVADLFTNPQLRVRREDFETRGGYLRTAANDDRRSDTASTQSELRVRHFQHQPPHGRRPCTLPPLWLAPDPCWGHRSS